MEETTSEPPIKLEDVLRALWQHEWVARYTHTIYIYILYIYIYM